MRLSQGHSIMTEATRLWINHGISGSKSPTQTTWPPRIPVNTRLPNEAVHRLVVPFMLFRTRPTLLLVNTSYLSSYGKCPFMRILVHIIDECFIVQSVCSMNYAYDTCVTNVLTELVENIELDKSMHTHIPVEIPHAYNKIQNYRYISCRYSS